MVITLDNSLDLVFKFYQRLPTIRLKTLNKKMENSLAYENT